jgi:hypothetical protein
MTFFGFQNGIRIPILSIKMEYLCEKCIIDRKNLPHLLETPS